MSKCRQEKFQNPCYRVVYKMTTGATKKLIKTISIHALTGEWTEEKKKKMLGLTYKFFENMPNIQQIIETARKFTLVMSPFKV